MINLKFIRSYDLFYRIQEYIFDIYLQAQYDMLFKLYDMIIKISAPAIHIYMQTMYECCPKIYPRIYIKEIHIYQIMKD